VLTDERGVLANFTIPRGVKAIFPQCSKGCVLRGQQHRIFSGSVAYTLPVVFQVGSLKSNFGRSHTNTIALASYASELRERRLSE